MHSRASDLSARHDDAAAAPILVEGRTCWRKARAGEMAVIVDAAEYFSRLKAALLRAEHSVMLIGWDFDARIALERGDGDEGQAAVPNQLGRFLSHVIRENKALRVHILRWDLAFLKMPVRGTTSLFLLDWMTSNRLDFRLDAQHPAGACHHQKIVLIDDALAFCGGIDLTIDRWDTPEHLDDDPRRTRPNGALCAPWHDATIAVSGAAARALGELARHRWLLATGERLEPTREGVAHWPEDLEPDFRNVEVAIARTEPAHEKHDEVREIEALYLAAIRAAERTIYIESQYLSGHRIADALAKRLSEPGGPEVVIVNPKSAQGWLEEEAMGSARALLLERLRAADPEGRLRVFTPVTEGGTDIYVHAKIVVIDDRLLRIGSSNVNNRSMGLDTECDLAVEVRPGEPGEHEMRAAIARIRDGLICEHLGIAREAWRATLSSLDGSLVAAIDRHVKPAGTGRTLLPFTPPVLNEAQRRLAESRALDPDRPENIARTFRRSMSVLPGFATGVGLATGGVALAGTVAALIRLSRRAR